MARRGGLVDEGLEDGRLKREGANGANDAKGSVAERRRDIGRAGLWVGLCHFLSERGERHRCSGRSGSRMAVGRWWGKVESRRGELHPWRERVDGQRGRCECWREVTQEGRGAQGGAIRAFRCHSRFRVPDQCHPRTGQPRSGAGRVRPHCWDAAGRLNREGANKANDAKGLIASEGGSHGRKR